MYLYARCTQPILFVYNRTTAKEQTRERNIEPINKSRRCVHKVLMQLAHINGFMSARKHSKPATIAFSSLSNIFATLGRRTCKRISVIINITRRTECQINTDTCTSTNTALWPIYFVYKFIHNCIFDWLRSF